MESNGSRWSVGAASDVVERLKVLGWFVRLLETGEGRPGRRLEEGFGQRARGTKEEERGLWALSFRKGRRKSRIPPG
ncbi:hypothetical protein IEQ34_013501 [Dendrobium chrysotoxum]|uniref:Uncharacterized protein n=1 Tax=Dendrobium chrysotoxum TaxID=161865 RepID=A0AAV7GNQ5_DENCH|nr:hypothetical protein IEQ34_013501 [Dendrobium chrysotoxum]